MKSIKRVIRWSLITAILLYVVSGFGITEFRVVETLTFGLLTKQLAFKLHDYIFIPFAILLAMHILLALAFRNRIHSKNVS
ncbi:hypothetical protein ACFLVE_02035 [Chloroflexota bacterium]